jgi:uncharacterized damage-inducible protein DinB
MINAEGWVHAFMRNAGYVNDHLNGLTHAEALLQPPANGNCILWILGHIVCYRNAMLTLLALPPVLPAAVRYDRGSAPVLADEPDQPRFEALLAAFNEAQATILNKVRQWTPEEAAEVIVKDDLAMTRAERLMSFMRHESYHAGQFELLREIALSQRSQA